MSVENDHSLQEQTPCEQPWMQIANLILSWAGSFSSPSFSPFHCSPFGAVPKKDGSLNNDPRQSRRFSNDSENVLEDSKGTLFELTSWIHSRTLDDIAGSGICCCRCCCGCCCWWSEAESVIEGSARRTQSIILWIPSSVLFYNRKWAGGNLEISFLSVQQTAQKLSCSSP